MDQQNLVLWLQVPDIRHPNFILVIYVSKNDPRLGHKLFRNRPALLRRRREVHPVALGELRFRFLVLIPDIHVGSQLWASIHPTPQRGFL